MKKFDAGALALSHSSIWSVVYLICALSIWIAPQGSLKFFSLFFHGINLTKIYDPAVGFGSAILGLILIFVIVYVLTYLFAAIYNSLSKE